MDLSPTQCTQTGWVIERMSRLQTVNDRTILDGYPLPSLKHFTAKIRGATVFSRVYLMKAFHQIPLDKESQRKSTVVTPWGAWQFVRLPMGLRNSAQSFQRLIDHVLNGIEDIFVYLDDILVFSRTLKEHMKTLEEIFRRLEENGLALSLKKCRFGEQKIEFVGYSISREGITPLPRKLTATESFPAPQKQKHLLGFLGAINYYRRNLSHLKGKNEADVLQPLYTAAKNSCK